MTRSSPSIAPMVRPLQARAQLPDHIRPGVRALLVGINPGVRSAAVGHHFAGYSNRFWKLLYESKLVPIRLSHEDDRRLPEWGLGITNLVARPSRGIEELTRNDYILGRERLLKKIRRYRPRVVVLLGVTIHEVLSMPRVRGSQQDNAAGFHRLGLQPDTVGAARVFVLPNPSGRNAHYPYRQMLKAFRSLKDYLEADAKMELIRPGF